MLKRSINNALRLLGKVVAFFFPYQVASGFTNIYNKIYTGWISSEFKNIGEKSIIEAPMTLLNGKYMEIGDEVIFHKNIVISAWDSYGKDKFEPKIVIGSHTNIGEDSHITANNLITIGRNVTMGRKVFITDNAHGSSTLEQLEINAINRPLVSKGAVVIEDNVWIGEKVSIMPNVRIGYGSIVAANAVVTKDVPPRSVVGGVPARIIKMITE